MLYLIYRIIIIAILAIIAILILKAFHKVIDRRRIFLVLCTAVLGYMVFTMLPIEQSFVRFNTPEQAFSYTHNSKTLVKIVNDENMAVAMYDQNGSLSFVIIEKDEKGWLMNNTSNGIKFITVDKYIITTAESSSHNKMMVFVNMATYDNEDSQLDIQDNSGSHYEKFEFVFHQTTTKFGYTVLNKPVSNYKVNINGIMATVS